MIKKTRKIIAYTLSIAMVVISLGIIRPNFSGEPTGLESSLNRTNISKNIDSNNNHKKL
jgi:hypothetical protein